MSRRLALYYSLPILFKSNMLINKALLKYGYSNFTLEILEYCEPENAVSREQYYIDLFKPECNLLKTAGSLLGFKHSEETRDKLAAVRLGKNHTIETLAKISTANKGKKRSQNAGSPPQRIEVLDLLTNKSTEFDSIGVAARAIGIKQPRISEYLLSNSSNKKPYKGRYVFRKI
jgi:group I intron endonuclease